MSFTKKYISCFIICPAKNGLERFNWFEEYTRDYIPSEVSEHIQKLGELHSKDVNFNNFGYLVVPKDIFYTEIKTMVSPSNIYYEDDKVAIYSFDNKLEIFYKPFFMPHELKSSLKYFGLN
jgi:hypothetical protein